MSYARNIFIIATFPSPIMAQKTVLYSEHEKLGAKFVEFAGAVLPIEYSRTGMIPEHICVRTGSGIFDVSHMGRLFIRGKGATGLLQYCLTNDVSRLGVGEAQYSFLIGKSEAGRPLTLDDVYLYKTGQDEFFLVVNAANRLTDLKRIQTLAPDYDATIEDLTSEIQLIAVQGPKSKRVLEDLVGEMSHSGQNQILTFKFKTKDVFISTTGYTGEFCRYEAFVPTAATADFWLGLIEAGAAPAGLGARNTLRAEAGLILFGDDTTPSVSPVEAGMKFAVKPNKNAQMAGSEFYQQQLKKEKEGKIGSYLVQVEFQTARKAEPTRDANANITKPTPLYLDGRHVGEITTGVNTPIIRQNPEGVPSPVMHEGKYALRSIGLGYASQKIAPGTLIEAQFRSYGQNEQGIVLNALLNKAAPLRFEGLDYTLPITHYH